MSPQEITISRELFDSMVKATQGLNNILLATLEFSPNERIEKECEQLARCIAEANKASKP